MLFCEEEMGSGMSGTRYRVALVVGGGSNQCHREEMLPSRPQDAPC